MFERMKSRAAGQVPTRRSFVKNSLIFALGGLATGAAGMMRDEALMWGAEKAADMAGVGSDALIPTAAYASTPRTVEQFMPQAEDYQLAALEAWRARRGMDDLPEICRDRAARTFEGPHGLRHVKEIGKGLRLWGSEIEGMPLVQAFDAEYGRWCASRLNKCRLEQEAYAEACVAVIRRADGPPRYVRYLTLLLPWENGDVVSVSRPLEVRDA